MYYIKKILSSAVLIAATSSHIKFIELAKKPHIFGLFLASFSISVLSIFCTMAFGQPLVLSNDQLTPDGLDSGINISSPTRKKIDLAGTWQYFREKSWYSFSDQTWEDIKIPSSIDYEGRMTFRRTITIDERLINDFAFKFVALGINYECEVYINDIFVGKHVGGYTSFEFDIAEDVLQIGQENVIKVIVSNQLNASTTLPIRKQIWGWKNYGGILRDVYLLATPRLRVDRVSIRTVFNQQMEQANVQIESIVSNRQFGLLNRDSLSARSKQTSYLINAELHERFSDLLVAQGMSAPLTIESNKDVLVQLSLTVNSPKLWSPENPNLYILKTSIISIEGKQRTILDQHNLNMGFSSIQVEDNALVLNRNNIKLKGVVWHEDSPEFGASLSYEQMEKDVVLIKSLGANAIRFAYHSPHPYMLNLCSRYGLMALEELPVWNVPANILDSEAFQSLAETQTREMIERDGAYPCVIAWGVGDQFDSADKQALGFVNKITGIVRELDNRPVYYGSRMLNNDVCASAVDFVGIILPPTDVKNFRKMLLEWKEKHPNRPLVVLSYGKEVDQNNRNGYSDPMSQEAQARFYLQYYAALKDLKATGSFTAGLADWRGDRPLLNFGLSDHYLHPVGLLSQSREKRLAYDVVRQLYNEERINAIPAGNYRKSFPWVHVLLGLFVIILIGYESTNRRFSESLKRSILRSYNFFIDLRNSHNTSILHTLILSFAISLTFAVLVSSILYHYRGNHFADYIVTLFCVWNPVKEQFINASWNPFIGIAALTGICLVLGVLLTLPIKFFSLFVKTRVSWLRVYSVLVWSAVPIILLSPLAMSLFKIMENPSYVIPSFIIILLFLIWTFLRAVKGIVVVFDLNPIKTYISGFIACVIILGGLFFYYDSVYGLSSNIKLVIHFMQNLG